MKNTNIQGLKILSSIIKEDVEISKILSYHPEKIKKQTPSQVFEFSKKNKKHKTDFRMNYPISLKSGVADIEMKDLQDQMRLDLQERIKSEEEGLRQKVLSEGHEEGRKQGIAEFSESFEIKLKEIESIINSLSEVKEKFILTSESIIISLVHHIATKIAMKSIEEDKEAILPVLQGALELLKQEEKIEVLLSPADFSFLNEVQQEVKKIDLPAGVELKVEDEVQSGGCVVSSNHVELDLNVKKRVDKIWENLLRVSPPLLNKVESEGS